MIEFTKKQFQEENKNGIYIFVVDDCSVCRTYIAELKKIDTSNWHGVNCNEDIYFYFEDELVDDMPCTRIYKNNKVVWEKRGVLYSAQIQEMYKQL